MVVHEFVYSGGKATRTVRVYTDEEVTVMILAGNDPRGKPYTFIDTPRIVVQCKCPKIGRKYCGTCKGEGRYYYYKH